MKEQLKYLLNYTENKTKEVELENDFFREKKACFEKYFEFYDNLKKESGKQNDVFIEEDMNDDMMLNQEILFIN